MTLKAQNKYHLQDKFGFSLLLLFLFHFYYKWPSVTWNGPGVVLTTQVNDPVSRSITRIMTNIYLVLSVKAK